MMGGFLEMGELSEVECHVTSKVLRLVATNLSGQLRETYNHHGRRNDCVNLTLLPSTA